MDLIKKYLGKDSPISGTISNYETRPQQIKMAGAVREALLSKKNLIAEAGTGIGKSFAYLVPFILWLAEKKERRAVISTYTKTLQEQLIKKDIPALTEIMPGDIKAEICVGSSNYICLSRFNRAFTLKLTDSKKEAREIEKTAQWLNKTETGLNMDMNFKISPQLWADICREGALCRQRNCSFYKKCYFYKSRRRISKASLLVANHHLLLTDIASGGHLLPSFESIVFDEAHNMEDIASHTLGIRVSALGIKQLLGKIYSTSSSRCLVKRCGLPSRAKGEIIREVKKTALKSDLFFTSVVDELGSDRDLNYRIRSPGLFENILSPSLISLSETMDFKAAGAEKEETVEEFKSYAASLRSRAEDLNNILSAQSDKHVFYIRIKAEKSRIFTSFNATPVDVSKLLQDLVFKPYSPVVMTSASLSVGESFNFIKSRTGISKALELKVKSPFNYSRKVLFYSPPDIPDPSLDLKLFLKESVNRISSLLQITSGRTFILFTSYRMLDYAAKTLKKRFPELNFLVQGRLPCYKMLDLFKRNPSSVLMGTSTFWQGIDAPGRILECVIITKLPFFVPDDPVVEARMEKIKREGMNPFWDYQIPSAALLFRQGFGRLIRHRDDFGIVAVLDPRLRRRRYGRVFISTLPPCRYLNSIEELHEEYEGLKRTYGT